MDVDSAVNKWISQEKWKVLHLLAFYGIKVEGCTGHEYFYPNYPQEVHRLCITCMWAFPVDIYVHNLSKKFLCH